MLNFWNIFFFLSLLLMSLFFLFKTPSVCLFISEINWIVFITNSIVFAANNNDPRYLLITLLFIFLASIEIALYLINFTFKNICLNFIHTFIVYWKPISACFVCCMFKNKNYLSLVTLFTIYIQSNTTVYKNDKFNSNTIGLKMANYNSLHINHCSDFNKMFAIDISAVNINNVVVTNNMFYSYKWDTYINIIYNTAVQNTQKDFYCSRLWPEREVSELFGISFVNAKDCRHLLLNYNDNIKYLLKSNSVQSVSDIRTNWHTRKIYKIKNNNVEL